jgi:hypothetical protein
MQVCFFIALPFKTKKTLTLESVEAFARQNCKI